MGSEREWLFVNLNYRESYKNISTLAVISTEPDVRYSLMQASAREKSARHLDYRSTSTLLFSRFLSRRNIHLDQYSMKADRNDGARVFCFCNWHFLHAKSIAMRQMIRIMNRERLSQLNGLPPRIRGDRPWSIQCNC